MANKNEAKRSNLVEDLQADLPPEAIAGGQTPVDRDPQQQAADALALTEYQQVVLSLKMANALNRLFSVDPAAVAALVLIRVPVDSSLKEDGLCQTDQIPVRMGKMASVPMPAITVLSLLNAAMDAVGLPNIAIATGNRSGELRGFVPVRAGADGTIQPVTLPGAPVDGPENPGG